MATYWMHKATHSRDVTYSFQCEHCMKDCTSLTAKIKGSEMEYRSPSAKLTEKQNHKLQTDAHDSLVRCMHSCFTDATENNLFSAAFSDKCVHCQQPQSWAVLGLKNELFSTPSGLAILGVLVGVGAYLYSRFVEHETNIKVAAIMGGAFLVLAAGSLIYNYVKLKIKISKTASSLTNNLPTIDWSNAQDLLDEYKENLENKNNKSKRNKTTV